MQIKIKIEKLFVYDQKQKFGLSESYQTVYFGKSEGGVLKKRPKKTVFGGFWLLKSTN